MKRLLPFLLVLSPSPAFAQRFEAALLAGYTTPGPIQPAAPGIQELEIAGSFAWGAGAGFLFSPRLGVEASWTRQESALAIATSRGSAEMFDVDVDRLHASLLVQLRGEGSLVRPFLSAGLGIAWFSASGLDGERKLSLGLGAGLRWTVTGSVGARFQGRYTPTYLNDTASDFCDPFGFCQGWLHQFELTGGLYVRF